MKRFFLAVGLCVAIQSVGAAQFPTPAEEKKGLLDRMVSGGTPAKPRYTPEEQQLQLYWSNYYRGLANYYASLNNVDWVAYYKANGYPIDPKFYNPLGLTPGTTLVPMQPIMAQGLAQPQIMKTPANPGGVVQTGAVMSEPVSQQFVVPAPKTPVRR